MFNQIDLAYLAGFIDGEGTICICRGDRRTYGVGGYLVLRATNTNKDIILWIRTVFGGSVIKKPETRNPKWADAYFWVVSSQKAENIIRELIPYLKVKRLQAETALRYRETYHRIDSMVAAEHGGWKVPGHIIEERVLLRNKMLELNKRGPKELPVM